MILHPDVQSTRVRLQSMCATSFSTSGKACIDFDRLLAFVFGKEVG